MAAATKNAPKAEGFQEVAPAEVAGGKTKKKREKKAKVKRVLWGTRDEKGNLTTPIAAGTTTFEGYNPKVHLPLRRKDFAEPLDFLKLAVARAEEALAAAKKELADESALGNAEQRAVAKQARSLREKLAKVEQQMREANMTDEQIAAFLS